MDTQGIVLISLLVIILILPLVYFISCDKDKLYTDDERHIIYVVEHNIAAENDYCTNYSEEFKLIPIHNRQEVKCLLEKKFPMLTFTIERNTKIHLKGDYIISWKLK